MSRRSPPRIGGVPRWSMCGSPPWPRSSRNRESTARQYDLAARAAELGWPRGAVRVIDDDLGLSGASTTGRSGFAELAAQVGLGQVGIVSGAGGFTAGPQQRRLVPAAGPGRDDRHADRRRRRRLPSGLVQRPDAAGHEGHHVRGRTARAARPPRRRDPQQGRPRRTAPRAAGRAGLGRGRRRDPAGIPTRPSPA